MIIQILDHENKTKAIVRDFYAMNSTRRINDEGTLSFGLSYDSPSIINNAINKKDKVRILYPHKYNESIVVFSGYILDIKPSNENISFIAKDWLEYTKHRLFRIKKTYTIGTSINSIVSDMFSYIDGIHSLPFLLRKNNCGDTITQSLVIEKSTSLFDALQLLVKRVNGLEIRTVSEFLGKNCIDYIDISTQSGDIKEGVWKSNPYQEENNNITNRSWNTSADDNPTMTINDQGVINEGVFDGIAYEKYINDANAANQDDIILPKINIDQEKEDWWNLELGDRKQTSIITKTDWLNIQYNSIVQGISYRADTTGVSVSFEIGDKLGSQKNQLDKTLSHLSYMVNYLAKKSVG